MESISKMAKKIINVFKKKAEIVAIETKFKQKESKLTPEALVSCLITAYTINSSASLETICALLKQNYNIKITKQGLSKRINNSKEFMAAMLNIAIKTLCADELKIPELLNKFNKIELLDSSLVNLPKRLKDEYPSFGGCRQSTAALRIQTLFNIAKNNIDNVEITPATKNDQSYRSHLNLVKENELYIQDLGYFCIESFKKISDKKAYFISRYLKDTKLYYLNNEKELLFVDYLKSNEFFNWISIDVLMGKAFKLPVRIIARLVPEAIADKRISDATKAAKRGYKLKESTLYLYKWDIYVTNVSEKTLAPEEIYIFYKLRWQAELLFKIMKSLAGIDKISGKKSPRIISEIYAKLLTVVVLLFITKGNNNDIGHEISLRKAFNKFKNYGLKFLEALKSEYLLKKLLKSLVSIFDLMALKEKGRKTKPTTLERLGALIYV